jgi:hypothetical protein
MVLPLQGRSHRFKSCSAHKGFSEIYPTKIQKTAQKPHLIIKIILMYKIIFLFVIFIVACGPSEDEIQTRVDQAVEEAVFLATSTTTTLPTEDLRLSNALDICELTLTNQKGVDLSSDNQSLYLDGLGQDEYRSGPLLSGKEIYCVLDALEAPGAIVKRIGNTNSLMGQVEDNFNDIYLSWTYHPDNGLDIYFKIQK